MNPCETKPWTWTVRSKTLNSCASSLIWNMQRKAQASPCPTIRRCMHPPEPVDRNQIGEFERKLEGRVPRPLRRKGRTGEVTNNDDGNDWVIVYRLAMIDDSELWPLPCNVHSKNLEASHLGVA